MRGQNVKNTMLDAALGLLAPHLCYGCNYEGAVLCDNCKYDIIKSSLDGRVSSRGPWVVGRRVDTLERLIDAYKFGNVKAVGKRLAELIDAIVPPLPTDTVIVPIPTITSHIRQRGYDQVLLMARHFGSLRDLLVEKILIRITTTVQHTADRKTRLHQASEAFRVETQLLPDRTYVLLDDIVTTGATLNAAKENLLAAGARVVRIVAVAAQPLD
jgi:competence protein ComFC